MTTSLYANSLKKYWRNIEMSNKPIQDEVTKHIEDLYHHLNDFILFTRHYNQGINKSFGISREFERSSSELINIRDAFMHFILYFEAEERQNAEKALEQWHYILEHGQRAVKDQFVFFCQDILEHDLQEWLNALEKSGNHADAVKATRVLMHDVKNTILRIRISSANGIRITDQKIKKVIDELSIKHIDFQKRYYPVIKEVCYPEGITRIGDQDH